MTQKCSLSLSLAFSPLCKGGLNFIRRLSILFKDDESSNTRRELASGSQFLSVLVDYVSREDQPVIGDQGRPCRV